MQDTLELFKDGVLDTRKFLNASGFPMSAFSREDLKWLENAHATYVTSQKRDIAAHIRYNLRDTEHNARASAERMASVCESKYNLLGILYVLAQKTGIIDPEKSKRSHHGQVVKAGTRIYHEKRII
ncbi:MAG: hypothetical protein ABTQ34_00465 [Bdellovibrionales bacterium]